MTNLMCIWSDEQASAKYKNICDVTNHACVDDFIKLRVDNFIKLHFIECWSCTYIPQVHQTRPKHYCVQATSRGHATPARHKRRHFSILTICKCYVLYYEHVHAAAHNTDYIKWWMLILYAAHASLHIFRFDDFFVPHPCGLYLWADCLIMRIDDALYLWADWKSWPYTCHI
jgi:hypothetical protein